MATTLPTLTRTIDDLFTTTWYEIRREAIDNILNSTPVWAALRLVGAFKPQVGGQFITRTIRHGTKTATAIDKGDVLSQGEDDIETMARWTWRYLSTHVQRSLIDDQKNNGPSEIKSLVATKIQAARDAHPQKWESDLLQEKAIVTAETGKLLQGLSDIVPVPGTTGSAGDWITGTYGQIARPSTYTSVTTGAFLKPTGGNTWWGPGYLKVVEPEEVNLVAGMRKLYNSIMNESGEPPNLILSGQTWFELYEDMALDTAQIMKSQGGLADLGFDVLKFKGKDMIWSANMEGGNAAGNSMLFLNTNYIDVVFDPQLWFDMTEWKPIPLQTERIAHIVSTLTVVSSQLRAHGRLYDTGDGS